MHTYTQSHTVKPAETAEMLGSGALPVYATPAMIALMENTAAKVITHLPEELTTVGIEINARHLKASAVGEKLTCTATLINHQGKIYEFQIAVFNEKGAKIGGATHKRSTVDKIDFMKKTTGNG